MEDKILIEIGENKLCKIRTESNAGIETKYVSFKDVVNIFTSANLLENKDKKEEFIKSPILPQFTGISTIQYLESENTQVYVLKKDKCRMDMSYFKDKFNNVDIPTLLFKIKVSTNSIRGIELVAVKDKIIKGNTVLFKYPFSNVFPDTKVCLGANNIASLEVDETAFIYRIPNLVLSLDNNNDAYHNVNNTGLPLRELLHKLSDEDFNSEWLNPLNMTYETWINK